MEEGGGFCERARFALVLGGGGGGGGGGGLLCYPISRIVRLWGSLPKARDVWFCSDTLVNERAETGVYTFF